MTRRLLRRRGGGNNDVPPGMPVRTQVGMIGMSPQNSAYLTMKNANSDQALASQLIGGKKNKRGGNVNVPVFTNMPYKAVGGPGNTPNDLIIQNSSSGIQGAANAKFDQDAFNLKGGKYRKSKRTRKTRTKSRKTRTKSRKTRKTRKSRKTRTKSRK
jgi:hypothetical protein